MALDKQLAIYAGTFDPLTKGHEDLVRRGTELFDKVIVAIAQSSAKRPFFSLEERVDMAKEVLSRLISSEMPSTALIFCVPTVKVLETSTKRMMVSTATCPNKMQGGILRVSTLKREIIE